jgi:hypothetical protein
VRSLNVPVDILLITAFNRRAIESKFGDESQVKLTRRRIIPLIAAVFGGSALKSSIKY